jgi:hypothetical protein
MKEKLYLFIATLFHPFLLSAIWITLIVIITQVQPVFLSVLIVFVSPLILFLFLGFNLYKPRITQRRWMYVILMLCYTIHFLYYFNGNDFLIWFAKFDFQWILALIFLLLLSFWKNFSWHTMGLGILTLELYQMSDEQWFSLAIPVVISLLVAYVRNRQKAHSWFELAGGYAIGVLSAFVVNFAQILLIWILRA